MAKRRKHGDGSVYLRKDGRWEGRIVIGYDEKGLPKTNNVLAKTKTECAVKLKELRERLETPAPNQPGRGSRWVPGWTAGIRNTRKQTSGPTPQCHTSGGSISTSSPP